MISTYYPTIFNRFPELLAVQSTRHGGVSPPPYYSLNLGLNTKDALANVEENRQRFFEAIDIEEHQLASSYQVHEDKIIKIENAGRYKGYDALITEKAGLFISVTIADCTPVLIYDPQRKVVAAIHAGWRGTVAQIVDKTMAAMTTHYGCDPRDCYAYIGSCIDYASFEVDADVADHFDASLKTWDASKKKFFVDLKAANREQLLLAGLREKQIELSPHSTIKDNHIYFSYRKEKATTGRMLALIGIRA